MPNTSATGGYLPQTSATQTESQALRRFIQTVIVGITALAPEYVRQNWQPNPPPMPAIDVNWCGFGIIKQTGDDNAYHDQLYEEVDEEITESADLVRHETLDILCSFYGSGCLDYAGRLRDGFQIGQNREQLFLVGMGFVGASNIIHVPELVNDRFFDRADVTITLRREIKRNYPILSFVAASGIVYADSAVDNQLVIDWQA